MHTLKRVNDSTSPVDLRHSWRSGPTGSPIAWALPLLAGLLLTISCPAIQAADKAPAPGGKAEVEKPQEPDQTLREQTIYIPYEKLRKVFEKEGRGVFLPYEKFQELWQAADQKHRRPVTTVKPPVPWLIAETNNEATVAKDVVRVKSVMKIEVLADGWLEVPLRLGDVAISEATLDGRPARLLGDDTGYRLLVHNETAKPQQLELVLHFAKAITRAPGQNSVSFEIPQTPVSRWKVTIPEPGVKVNLHPLLAATEVAPETAEKKTSEKTGKEKEDKTTSAIQEKQRVEQTVVLAFVGASPVVRIDWTPKAEGATGLDAMASVQSQQEVTIAEGAVRCLTRFAYAISRAELRQLSIEAPGDYKVVNIFDANVRQWSVEPAGTRQKITVQLFEAAKLTQNLRIELEKLLDDKELGSIEAPLVKALGVGRQQGVVLVRVAEGLRGTAGRTTGLLQVDAGEFAPESARAGWTFAYRYAAVPFALPLTIEKVEPRVLADSLVEAELQPESLALDMLTVYTIQRAGIFRLELDIPAGYEVRQVTGRSAAGAADVQVDAHHLVDRGKDKPRRLVVNLSRKAIGKVALVVQLHKDLHEASLLVPSAKPIDLELAIPRVAAETVERAAGRLVVHAPESLRVNPGKIEPLRIVSFPEAMATMESQRRRTSDARPVLAFAYAQDPGVPVFSVLRRKPQVTIRQFLVARVEDGVVKYQATFFYNILYGRVKSLRIDLPETLASQVHNATPGMPEKTISPPPADLAKGDVAWSLAGQNELAGDGKIELAWETKIAKIELGGSIALDVPSLKPRDVDRAWGQIVLAKTETIDIQESTEEPKGLRPIDPQHDLMPGASSAGAARAYEFHDDWTLRVLAARYQLEETKRTSTELALLRMVVTRADKVSVQALYRMRSAQQRLVLAMPAGAKIDVDPRIDGRQVRLEKGQADQVFVPLTQLNPEKAFVLELRYTVPGDGSRLEYPDFPVDELVQPYAPAVQKVYLAVYLPKESILLGRSGPWTDEFTWRRDGMFHTEPSPHESDSHLAASLLKGISSDTFATDGRMYLFSTLHPASPQTGALGLSRVRETWFHALVFCGVFVGGVLLLGARVTTRGMALGVLVIAMLLCGVFAPILSQQLQNATVTAAVCVLVLWAAWQLRFLPQWSKSGGQRGKSASFPAELESVMNKGNSTTAGTPATSPENLPSPGESQAEPKPESPAPSKPESQEPSQGPATDQPKHADDEGGQPHA